MSSRRGIFFIVAFERSGQVPPVQPMGHFVKVSLQWFALVGMPELLSYD
jgi:hypothetical protein